MKKVLEGKIGWEYSVVYELDNGKFLTIWREDDYKNPDVWDDCTIGEQKYYEKITDTIPKLDII